MRHPFIRLIACLVTGWQCWLPVWGTNKETLVTTQASTDSEIATTPAKTKSGHVMRVVGNKRIPSSTILEQCGVNDDPDEWIKGLMKTNYFSDVTINRKNDTWTIAVVERPTISKVTFQGNSAIKNDQLNQGVKIGAHDFLSPHLISETVSLIQQTYASLSFFNTKVTPKVIRRDDNVVDLIFHIDEGPRASMKLYFSGNHAFGANALKKVISLEEKPWYAIVPLFRSPNHDYHSDKLQDAKRALEEFYQNSGYLDVKVVVAQGELVPHKNYVAVSFVVNEGVRYRVGKTQFQGKVDGVDVDAFSDYVPWKTGQWCGQKMVDTFCEYLPWVVQQRQTKGVTASFRCTPELVKNQDGTADIVIQAVQGGQACVGSIAIEGNMRTQESVVRRALDFVEGDLVDSVRMKMAENALNASGLFQSVDVSHVPGDSPVEQDILVRIKERDDDRNIQGGISYSTFDGGGFRVEYTDANFRGLGQSIGVGLVGSQRNQQLSFEHVVPHLWDTGITGNWGTDILHQRGDTKGSLKKQGSYSEFSGGGHVGGEYVLVRNVRQKWGYSLRYAHLKSRKGSDMNPYELENIAERSYATLSTLSHTLSINVPLPTFMGRQSTAIIWGTAATGLGGNVSFLSNSVSLNHYIPLPSSFLLRFEASYRWKNPWGFMRFNDSLDLSGYDFPGFELGGLGPKDGFTNEALYGKKAYVVSAKLDVPLPTGVELPVKGLIFVQAGSLWDSLFKKPRTGMVLNEQGVLVQETRPIQSPNFFTRVSAGVGIQASLPMVGNIGFVFSRALRKHSSDVTKKFEIVMGTKL